MSTPVGLLDVIVRDALDPSYAEAAQRRSEHRPGAQPSKRWIGAGLMVAAGAIAGLAVSFQSKVIPQVGAARSALAGDAATRADQLKGLELQVAARQRELAALQQQRLQATRTGRALESRSGVLATGVAQTPVRGPGARITITDPAGAGVVVTDRDLQSVVNALWAGGAEAISVGGVRLGPQTAIRTAGQTILADFKALRSPYVIEAIGGPRLLATAEQSAALRSLQVGSGGTAAEVQVAEAPVLSLPAAGAGALTSARPATGAGS